MMLTSTDWLGGEIRENERRRSQTIKKTTRNSCREEPGEDEKMKSKLIHDKHGLSQQSKCILSIDRQDG